jgi:hypothetical protein
MLICTKASLMQAAMTAVPLGIIVLIVYIAASQIVKQKDDAYYGEKLDKLVQTVDAEYQTLAAIGLSETQVYVENIQKDLLASLAKAYDGRDTARMYLFIRDRTGKVVLHRKLASGSSEPSSQDIAKTIRAQPSGGTTSVQWDDQETCHRASPAGGHGALPG